MHRHAPLTMFSESVEILFLILSLPVSLGGFVSETNRFPLAIISRDHLTADEREKLH